VVEIIGRKFGMSGQKSPIRTCFRMAASYSE